MTNDLPSYIEETNRIRVGADALIASLNELAALGRGSQSFGSMSITKVTLEPLNQFRQPEVESAVLLRLLALARLVGRNENYGWEFPEPSGQAEFSSGPVFSAAAVEPLVAFDQTEFGFEPQSFALRVKSLGSEGRVRVNTHGN